MTPRPINSSWDRLETWLAESLLRHDGSGYFDVLGSFQLLSAQEMVSTRRLATQLEEDTQREGRAGHFILRDGYALWHPHDLPFAGNAGSSYWVLDTKPDGATRRIARHDELGTTTFDPHEMWESLSHLLDSVATALETSTPLERRLPTTADGRLTWQIITR
ncbi:hypothetical protein AB5J56_39500 [Streptomyces sp. R21]|uniref:SMI1/KNR4 family protein n=1 Tax=Streptomyces sp. R21 TaxID=3238627 RepID=A0AB39PN32_9ACTN